MDSTFTNQRSHSPRVQTAFIDKLSQHHRGTGRQTENATFCCWPNQYGVQQHEVQSVSMHAILGLLLDHLKDSCQSIASDAFRGSCCTFWPLYDD
jgi:hypothetical protein